jgi:hypothetical protein
MNISSPSEGVACESSESKSDTMAEGGSVLKASPRQRTNGTAQSVAQRAHALQTSRPRSSRSAAPTRRFSRRNAWAVRHDLLLVQRERPLHVQQPRHTSGQQRPAFPRRSELTNRLPVVVRPVACADIARGVLRARGACCSRGSKPLRRNFASNTTPHFPGDPLT